METFNLQRDEKSLRQTRTHIQFMNNCPTFIVKIAECAREGKAGSKAHDLREGHRKSIHKVSPLSPCLVNIYRREQLTFGKLSIQILE